MVKVNSWLGHLAHNYLLIVIAAIIFFGVKSVLGILTYKHYNMKLKQLDKKLDLIINKSSDE